MTLQNNKYSNKVKYGNNTFKVQLHSNIILSIHNSNYIISQTIVSGSNLSGH